MPRVTRAALRAQANGEPQYIHEDKDAAAEQAPQCFTTQEDAIRPPLREISESNAPAAEAQGPESTPERAKRNGTNPVRVTTANDPPPIPLNRSMEFPIVAAVEDAARKSEGPFQVRGDRLKPNAQAPETFQSPTNITEASHTEADKHLALPVQRSEDVLRSAQKVPKTFTFDPTDYAEEDATLNANNLSPIKDDSFVEAIKTRSPAKYEISTERGRIDSFTESISTRSPAKHPLGRIEDSVEAMDALNDAIEEIALEIPVLKVRALASPAKARSPARVIKKSLSPGSSTAAIASTTSAPKKSVSPLKAAMTHSILVSTKPPSGRISTSKPTGPRPLANSAANANPGAKGSLSDSRPPMSFSNSPAKPHPNIKQKRTANVTLSTGRPGFVPAKSTKAPTMSTFALPGEVIAAKLKAQREERQKRESTIEKYQKPFKARPIPAKTQTSIIPRANKTSQARMSLVAGNPSGSDKENIVPKKPQHSLSGTRQTSSISTAAIKKRTEPGHVSTGVRRFTVGPTGSSANKLRPSLAPTQDTQQSLVSTSLGQKPAMAKAEAVQQKARGKEVFGRNKLQMEQMEKERKDREEAAKEARATAAEKGRLASREWAQRQKKKFETEKKAAGIGAHESAAVAT